MRAIFPMYDTPFQFLVLENSGSQSVAEMVGKRVGVGPRGGTSAAYFPEFFKKLDIPVNLVFGEWAELAAQVHRRVSNSSPVHLPKALPRNEAALHFLWPSGNAHNRPGTCE